jgi:hypothetical protein
MKYFKLFILVPAIAISACEDIMDVSFSGNGEKVLVVEGSITTDTTTHQVTLSRTGDYFDKGAQDMESGAQVTITNGEKTLWLTEAEPGVYRTDQDVYGEIGKKYTLNIVLEDGSLYSASETISPLPEIDSIRQSDNYYHMVPPMEWFGYGYDILYYGPEPEGVGDCYLWNLYIDDILYTDTIFETVFTDDEFVDGNYIKDFDVFFVKDEDIHADSVKVSLVMYSISEEYYEFLIGLMLETKWRGSPWDGPPANVPSNISNGAKGYFRASDVKTSTTILHKLPRMK